MLNVPVPKSIPAQDVAQAMSTVILYNAVAHQKVTEQQAKATLHGLQDRLSSFSKDRVLAEAEKEAFALGMHLTVETRVFMQEKDSGQNICKMMLTPANSKFDFCAMLLGGSVMGSPNSNKQLSKKCLEFTMNIVNVEPLPTAH